MDDLTVRQSNALLFLIQRCQELHSAVISVGSWSDMPLGLQVWLRLQQRQPLIASVCKARVDVVAELVLIRF